MSSNYDEFINSTPPEVSEAAKKATLSLLPEKSTDKYLQAYQNFFLWKTSKDANSFSETHVTDAMQNACSKCTERQKKLARKVVKHIREHENDSWELLKAKYDPGDKFQDVYEEFLAADDERRR